MTFKCRDGTVNRLYGLTPWQGSQILKMLAKVGLRPTLAIERLKCERDAFKAKAVELRQQCTAWEEMRDTLLTENEQVTAAKARLEERVVELEKEVTDWKAHAKVLYDRTPAGIHDLRTSLDGGR